VRALPDLSHRYADVRLVVRGADGDPLSGVPIGVEQIRHAFGFGNIGFDFVDWAGGPPQVDGGDVSEFFGGAAPPDPEGLAADWLELFNLVTLPFYWRGFEPVPGQPQTERLRRTARWFADRGVQVKGHPLLWHTLAPPWLLDLDDEAVVAAIRHRIHRDATEFAGVVDMWDAINEPVILPTFAAEENAVTRLALGRGRLATIRLAFETARSADPSARLVINDFDLSERYELIIQECLAAGIAIDAIGLQTHMHQGYRGEEQIWNVLERFAQFGLPLQLTETTLLSGDLMPPEIVDLNDYRVDDWPTTPEGEERQADEIVRHYTTVLSHPAVESLTYWGITDHGAWLGAPSGLLRRDGSRKPSYDALHDLIRGQWWTGATTAVTDDAGAVPLRGFAGRYQLDIAGTRHEVDLAAGQTGDVVVEALRTGRPTLGV
jgi:GH35 family endo-1,4-beta-xylanase